MWTSVLETPPVKQPGAAPLHAIALQNGPECTYHAVARVLLRLWSVFPRLKAPSYNTMIWMMQATCELYRGSIDGLLRFIGDPPNRGEPASTFRQQLRDANIPDPAWCSYFEFPAVEPFLDQKEVNKDDHFILEFFLTEGQWKNFDAFFSSTPRATLTKDALNFNLPAHDTFLRERGGHAVVVDNLKSTPGGLTTLVDSHGTEMADHGCFAVESIDILQPLTKSKPPRLYCVVYREAAHVDAVLCAMLRAQASPSVTPFNVRQLQRNALVSGTEKRFVWLNDEAFQQGYLEDSPCVFLPVVVKRVSQSSADELRFVPEHPNIVRVHGYCKEFDVLPRALSQPGNVRTPTSYLIVMETGGTPLAQHAGGLPVEERLRLLQDIASAVAYLTGCRVIHGAISAKTIFKFEGAWKLMDVGCTEESDPPTEDGDSSVLAATLLLSRDQRRRTVDIRRLGELIKHLDLEGELLDPGLAKATEDPNMCRQVALNIRMHATLRLDDEASFRRWRDEKYSLHAIASDLCSRGRHAALEVLLHRGAIFEGDTLVAQALASAASNGHAACVELMCRSAPFLTRNHLSAALLVAARSGHPTCLESLIKHEADPNVKCQDGFTPLHLCASQGATACVRALIGRGASVDVRDNDARTALWHCANQGHAECLEYLVDQGADVNAEDVKGWTAMHVAAARGWLPVVETLTQPRSSSKVNINYLDHAGCTPFMIAAYTGQLSALQHLLDKGCTTNDCDAGGLTAFHHAVIQGHVHCVEFMMNLGEQRLRTGQRDREGRNAVTLAAIHHQTECCRLLLRG